MTTEHKPHSMSPELRRRIDAVLSVTPMDEWLPESELLYQASGVLRALEEQLEATLRELANLKADEWFTAAERSIQTEQERADRFQEQYQAALVALRSIESMAGAAGAGETPAMPIAAKAREVLYPASAPQIQNAPESGDAPWLSGWSRTSGGAGVGNESVSGAETSSPAPKPSAPPANPSNRFDWRGRLLPVEQSPASGPEAGA